jgi:hypothetical protein
MTAYAGKVTTTTPTLANNTNVNVLALNYARKYLLIQNNSAASIGVSFDGFTLTGTTPTSTNIVYTIAAGGYYESPPMFVPYGAINIYQSSGGPINTVTVGEG